MKFPYNLRVPSSCQHISEEQAKGILDYLAKQKAIYGHDDEAHKLHSGASFILTTLGITEEHLQIIAEENDPERLANRPSYLADLEDFPDDDLWK